VVLDERDGGDAPWLQPGFRFLQNTSIEAFTESPGPATPGAERPTAPCSSSTTGSIASRRRSRPLRRSTGAPRCSNARAAAGALRPHAQRHRGRLLRPRRPHRHRRRAQPRGLTLTARAAGAWRASPPR
jgi:hypothetical protein